MEESGPSRCAVTLLLNSVNRIKFFHLLGSRKLTFCIVLIVQASRLISLTDLTPSDVEDSLYYFLTIFFLFQWNYVNTYVQSPSGLKFVFREVPVSFLLYLLNKIPWHPDCTSVLLMSRKP